MALPIKRAPATAQAAGGTFDFGADSSYAGGGGLPEGDYCWTKLMAQMFQAQNQQTGIARGPARLGIMIDMVELADPTQAHQQFYSLGSKANLSFMPTANGKGLTPVPNAPGQTLNDQTNWALLLKSLKDCGLPEGILGNDLSVLEGTWVHMAQVEAPKERKGFASQAQTGEAALNGQSNDPNRKDMIAIVQEIKEDGKPWEGTGGMLTTTAVAKPNGKPAVKPVVARPAAAAPTPTADFDVEAIAQECVYAVLEKKQNGGPRASIRNEAFKAITAKYGDVAASAVMDTYFVGDDELNACLNPLGFGLVGAMVKPLA